MCGCRIGYCPVCAAGTGYQHDALTTSCLFHTEYCPEREGAPRRVKSAPRADRTSTIATDAASPHFGHLVVTLDEGRWHCETCDGPYEEDS